MNVSEILNKAADLIEPKGAWGQGWFRRDANGNRLYSNSKGAVCFCVAGAIAEVGGSSVYNQAWDTFDKWTKQRGYRHLAHWNDDPSRTQAEVVTALREAAKRAAE